MIDEPDIRFVPLSKLIPSSANVRKTGREIGIEELAASIGAHGLLQNLTVRAVVDRSGDETGKFEVVAGGRRLAALKLLAKRRVITKNHPVPCALMPAFSAEEVSLAENTLHCPMHPADQYEAFEKLHRKHGLSADDIAARFGVTPAVVKQRMKLGAVSPALMNVYREGDMTLEQLMAFTITDDHSLQERVWLDLSWNKSREMIRRRLTEDRVDAADRRALYVGAEAYEAAGGHVIRDLFDDAHGGFFDDPALLDKLVQERLEVEGQRVQAEGWRWVTVALEFNYSLSAGMRRVHPVAVPLTEDEQRQLEALQAEYETLSIQHEDKEVSEEVEAEFARLENAMAALQSKEAFRPEDVAIAGAFVSLGFDGSVRIERGFVRPEDDPERSQKPGEGNDGDAPAGDTPSENEETDGDTRLSDRLMVELTAHRTAGLRDALAQQPQIALITVVHALTLSLFYPGHAGSCLEIKANSVALQDNAPGIDESPAERAIAARHAQWVKRLPREAGSLWDHLAGLEQGEVLELLAHCASLSVNAVRQPWERKPEVTAHADVLAGALALDMTAYWTPTTTSYFGRVTKAHMLDAVAEAISGEAATRLVGMKKQPMAEAAAELIKGTGWLPPVLRTPKMQTASEPYAMAAE